MYALSQILVVSMENNAVQDAYCGPTSYLDLLASESFGNFSSLLKRVALSPVMGEYLNHKGSAKLDPVTGQIPNENFAREVLQLFSIGTVMLNQDGTVIRDAQNKPVQTYDQPEVQGFAKAFSGFAYAGQDQTKPWRWLDPDIWDTDHVIKIQKACPAWTLPMEPWLATYRSADDTRSIAGPAHDATAKQLLSYPGAVYSNLPADRRLRRTSTRPSPTSSTTRTSARSSVASSSSDWSRARPVPRTSLASRRRSTTTARACAAT